MRKRIDLVFRSVGNILKYIDVLDFEKAIVLNKTDL
jgi:hypothetical protein